MRLATLDDLQWIVETGEQCYLETKLPGMFHPVHFRRTVSDMLHNPNAVILIDEQRRGGIAGVVYKDPFTADVTCQRFFWYVFPPFRGKWVAPRMLKALERWAIDKGAVEMLVGDPTPYPYERYGYRSLEKHYRKVL